MNDRDSSNTCAPKHIVRFKRIVTVPQQRSASFEIYNVILTPFTLVSSFNHPSNSIFKLNDAIPYIAGLCLSSLLCNIGKTKVSADESWILLINNYHQRELNLYVRISIVVKESIQISVMRLAAITVGHLAIVLDSTGRSWSIHSLGFFFRDSSRYLCLIFFRDLRGKFLKVADRV